MSQQQTPKKPKKKERPRYIDDGRTIVDMTPVDEARGKRRTASYGGGRPRSSFKDQFRTYIESVKMMFVPMLVTIGIISAAFLIFWLLTG
jgi:hypothetical protein